METIISIDIGGTNIRIAVIDQDLNVLYFVKEKTIRENKKLFLDNVITMVKKISIQQYNPKAISIGVAGRVRNENTIDELPNIGIKNVDLATLLNDEFHLPVFIRHDAEMAVIAHANSSTGKLYKRVYFVTISTGLGGALSIDGEVANYIKEIGHTPFLYKGKLYDLESIVAGRGIIKLASMNGLTISSARELFDLVKTKDPLAESIFEDWINLIEDFFKFVHEALRPDVYFIGGGFMNEKELFFERLKRDLPGLNLIADDLKDEVTLIGAAIYGFGKI